MTKQFAERSIASKLSFPTVVVAATLFTTSAQANNFEMVRSISAGSSDARASANTIV